MGYRRSVGRPLPIGAEVRRRAGLWACGVWALCWCASAVAGEAPSVMPAVSSITGITFERNCFGCPAAYVLVLRRDGTAIYTQAGNLRHGTADAVSKGTVRPADFDKLAGLAVAAGFFEMSDSYQDPQLQDGPWTTTTISRGAQDKSVFRRDDAGPATLNALEAAIESVRAQIRFVAER